jgi:hypothetical protein
MPYHNTHSRSEEDRLTITSSGPPISGASLAGCRPLTWGVRPRGDYRGKVSFPTSSPMALPHLARMDVVYILRYNSRHGRALSVARHHLYLGRR